jgi:hypothetical protein
MLLLFVAKLSPSMATIWNAWYEDSFCPTQQLIMVDEAHGLFIGISHKTISSA